MLLYDPGFSYPAPPSSESGEMAEIAMVTTLIVVALIIVAIALAKDYWQNRRRG